MQTALQLACELGFEDIAILLVNKLDDQSLLKQSILHFICSCKHKEQINTIQIILNRLNETYLKEALLVLDRSKKTLLQIAIENNHLKIIDSILSVTSYLFKKPDLNGNLLVHYAAKVGTLDIFNILSKYDLIKFDFDSNDQSPLHIAANYNRFVFIKMLLNYEKFNSNQESLEYIDDQYIPLVSGLNKQNNTALQISLIKSHNKCVEELVNNSNDIDLDVKDNNNHSIYHLCILNSNLESIRYLMNRKLDKFLEPLFIKTKKENETVFHLACRVGSIESIKLILTKLIESRYSNSIEYYLKEKNKDGQTCFHLAAIYGFFNIIEYFLKEMKTTYFIELTNNSMRTCLIEAAKEDHLKICQILIEYGANLYAVDNDYKNSLQYSCELKHFDISKVLIKYYDQEIEKCYESKHPIHLAAHEGAHQVIEILLERKVPIDLLDDNNENCLDIAIRQEHIQCIKILLNHEHWHKLFSQKNNSNDENRQLVGLFSKKMYNIIEMILDKSVIEENKQKSYDFTVLDPDKFFNIQKHPLMLLQRSGQENLIKHEIINVLLELKWRFLPRILFYSNLIIHFIFLILFVNYSINLTDRNDSNTLKFSLLIMCSLILFINLLQLILVDGLSFFFNIESWFEILTLISTLFSINTDVLVLKSTYCSIVIMLAFLNFAFSIEKLKIFGVYVLAFKSTIKNSAKFFPVFFLIYMGFILSFKIRTSTKVQYFNDTIPSSMLKGITMMLGDLPTDNEMGLKDSYFNYILYLLFILLISIIMLNLFVGIAVGEVTTVLAKAKVQQISIRILFVLKLQYALKFIKKNKILNRFIGMNYSFYEPKIKDSFWSRNFRNVSSFIQTRLLRKDTTICLIDPNLRLEEKISLIFNKTDSDCREIKNAFAHQINNIEMKLNSSNQRLEDYLIEMSRKSLNNFDIVKDDSATQLTQLGTSLHKSQQKIQENINFSRDLTNKKIDSVQEFFSELVHDLKAFETDQFQTLNYKTNNIRDSLELISLIQKNDNDTFKNNFDLTNRRINMVQIELERLVNLFESVEAKLDTVDHKLNLVDILVRRETVFSSKLDLSLNKLDDLMERQLSIENYLNNQNKN